MGQERDSREVVSGGIEVCLDTTKQQQERCIRLQQFHDRLLMWVIGMHVYRTSVDTASRTAANASSRRRRGEPLPPAGISPTHDEPTLADHVATEIRDHLLDQKGCAVRGQEGSNGVAEPMMSLVRPPRAKWE